MMALFALKPLKIRTLVPMKKVKDVRIHNIFSIVHHYQNVFIVANSYSADPDGTQHFVASHLGLRYSQMLPILKSFP